MFVFICPIRHPKTATDYSSVILFLQQTINSLNAQQTKHQFKIVVVCNEVPLDPQNYHNTDFVKVNFPAPDLRKGSKVPLDLVKDDKGCKYSVGLLYAQKYQPDYVYLIDGDDWFNINIVDYIYSAQPSDMFYANSGYVVNLKKQTYLKKYGLCRYCGSVYIYNYLKLMKLSCLEKLTYHDHISKDDIYSVVEPFFLKQVIGNHRHQLYTFRENNLTLTEIQIPTVAWILNTGENHSAQNPGKYGLPYSSAFLDLFGVKLIDFKPKNITLIQRIKAFYESALSYIGWRLTDKTKKMI